VLRSYLAARQGRSGGSHVARSLFRHPHIAGQAAAGSNLADAGTLTTPPGVLLALCSLRLDILSPGTMLRGNSLLWLWLPSVMFVS
jgi:hypothetical protein